MSDPLKWWRDALAGRKPRITNEPQCGFYKRRLVRGGPWVPVAIWYGETPLDDDGVALGDEPLLCAVNGRMTDPAETWTWVATEPITENEYAALVSDAKERQHGAKPDARQSHDLLTVPFPTFKRRDT